MARRDLYDALATSHRRRLLYHVLETGESTVEELATVLSGWEVATTDTMHTGEDRSKLRLHLVHNHLPRLADRGLILYDPETGSVELASLHPMDAEMIRRTIEIEGPDDR